MSLRNEHCVNRARAARANLLQRIRASLDDGQLPLRKSNECGTTQRSKKFRSSQVASITRAVLWPTHTPPLLKNAYFKYDR